MECASRIISDAAPHPLVLGSNVNVDAPSASKGVPVFGMMHRRMSRRRIVHQFKRITVGRMLTSFVAVIEGNSIGRGARKGMTEMLPVVNASLRDGDSAKRGIEGGHDGRPSRHDVFCGGNCHNNKSLRVSGNTQDHMVIHRTIDTSPFGEHWSGASSATILPVRRCHVHPICIWYTLVLRLEAKLSESGRRLLEDAELRLCDVRLPVRDKGSRPECDDVDAKSRRNGACDTVASTAFLLKVQIEASGWALQSEAKTSHRPTAAS